jgi:hypothetical protein
MSAAAALMILTRPDLPDTGRGSSREMPGECPSGERHAFDQGVGIPSGLFQMIFARFAEMP